MKQFFVQLLLALIFFNASLAQNKEQTVLVFDIKEEIAPSATRITTKAVKEAEKIGADLIIVHMNTYGGFVTDADSIRTRLLNCNIPTYVFIDNNAASAGALISLACDKIYMRPGGSIGAATVVVQSGEAAPDKYQSYMRKQMKSTAESHGFDTIINGNDTVLKYKRNPMIAQGMVDPSVVVPGLDDSLKVITLTTDEAIEWGYCEGKAKSIEEILEINNIKEYRIVKVEKSTTDKIFSFFANPVLRGMLITLMLGGIYFELQSPGIGFPLALAIAAAIAYFAPLYVDGLAANWEILVFIVGLVLIGLEIFVIPGFGVAGVGGIILTLFSLVVSMVRNVNFDFSMTSTEALSNALAVVFLSLVGFIAVVLVFGRSVLKSRVFQRLVLNDTLSESKVLTSTVSSSFDSLKGLEGLAHTAFRPEGKVYINNELYLAKTYGEFIDKGDNIRVTSIENEVLIVKKV
ncbi:nodulation protein NfeD [bacterium]|nr:nodulation protein NfeD [bacterium]